MALTLTSWLVIISSVVYDYSVCMWLFFPHVIGDYDVNSSGLKKHVNNQQSLAFPPKQARKP